MASLWKEKNDLATKGEINDVLETRLENTLDESNLIYHKIRLLNGILSYNEEQEENAKRNTPEIRYKETYRPGPALRPVTVKWQNGFGLGDLFNKDRQEAKRLEEAKRARHEALRSLPPDDLRSVDLKSRTLKTWEAPGVTATPKTLGVGDGMRSIGEAREADRKIIRPARAEPTLGTVPRNSGPDTTGDPNTGGSPSGPSGNPSAPQGPTNPGNSGGPFGAPVPGMAKTGERVEPPFGTPPSQPMPTPAPAPRSPENRERRASLVSAVLGANFKSIPLSIRNRIRVFAVSLAAGALIASVAHAEEKSTPAPPKTLQEALVNAPSWRSYFDKERLPFLKDISGSAALPFDKLLGRYVQSINLSNPATLEKIAHLDVEEVLNKEGAGAGLNETEHKEISDLVFSLIRAIYIAGRYANLNAKTINEIPAPGERGDDVYFGVTIQELYDRARKIITESDTAYTFRTGKSK